MTKTQQDRIDAVVNELHNLRDELLRDAKDDSVKDTRLNERDAGRIDAVVHGLARAAR